MVPRVAKNGFWKRAWKWARLPLHRREAWQKLARFHAAPPGSVAEMVDRALAFKARGLVQVSCHQVRDEIVALAERAAESKPRIVLEIGTYKGGTALIWAQLASERVITCDLSPMGHRAPLIEAFPSPTSTSKLVLMTGDSHAQKFCDRVAAELAGERVDLLFIDGDHSAEGVRRDYEMYRDFVRPGGLIAFHDIVEDQPLPENQVFEFWKDVRDLPGAFELVGAADQCGYGIGVLIAPEPSAS